MAPLRPTWRDAPPAWDGPAKRRSAARPASRSPAALRVGAQGRDPERPGEAGFSTGETTVAGVGAGRFADRRRLRVETDGVEFATEDAG